MKYALFLGITEISEGEVKGQELHLKSTSISRMSFANPPETLKVFFNDLII